MFVDESGREDLQAEEAGVVDPGEFEGVEEGEEADAAGCAFVTLAVLGEGGVFGDLDLEEDVKGDVLADHNYEDDYADHEENDWFGGQDGCHG